VLLLLLLLVGWVLRLVLGSVGIWVVVGRLSWVWRLLVLWWEVGLCRHFGLVVPRDGLRWGVDLIAADLVVRGGDL